MRPPRRRPATSLLPALALAALLLPAAGGTHLGGQFFVLNGVLDPPLGTFYAAARPPGNLGVWVCPFGQAGDIYVRTPGASVATTWIGGAGAAEVWSAAVRHANFTWDGVHVHGLTGRPLVQGTGAVRVALGGLEEFRVVVHGEGNLYLC